MAASNLASTLLTAAVVFASTNVDDIVLLSVLYTEPRLPARVVVLGQFVGIGALVAISAVAGLAAFAVPPGWSALLGAIPLTIGVFKLVRLIRRRGWQDEDSAEAHGGEATHGSSISTVAGVTIANGSDNLSVYIPLFAAERAAILVYACVFAVLTGVWCWLGYRLVSNRVVGDRLRRHGHIALPIVLILLGVHILSGARVLLQ